MRDHFDDADLDPPPPAFRLPRRLSAWAGTATLLGLAGAAAAWTYDLGTRDTAAIPVIRAITEEARISLADEDNPNASPHRDVLAYGNDETAATTLAPAPVAPAEEDLSQAEIEATFASVPLPPLAPEPIAAEEGDILDPEDFTLGDLAETAEAVPEGPNPPAGIGSDYAPAASPLAAIRPHNLVRRMARANEAAVEEAVALGQRAARSPWQIQLGAFRNEVLTREQWQLIYGAHAELLHNRALAVQTTLSGGRTFYRLRVGPFAGRPEAVSLCKALEARGQDCIVAANDKAGG
ncbi:MAG: SPOR domain-containing protein [Pseudomonadota bacterium]